jgi:hypothetical protein
MIEKVCLFSSCFCNTTVNHALIAIAQEVTKLLRQTYSIQTDEIETGETE